MHDAATSTEAQQLQVALEPQLQVALELQLQVEPLLLPMELQQQQQELLLLLLVELPHQLLHPTRTSQTRRTSRAALRHRGKLCARQR